MPRRPRRSRSWSRSGQSMPARDHGPSRGRLTTMASKKRILTWLGAFIAIFPVLIGCGSSVPARPAALDPSNPDAPESPRRVASEQPSAPITMDRGANAGRDANAAPMPHDPQPQPQGETSAPPMARTDTAAQPAPSSSDSRAVYTCPMHPEVTSDKPGRCPKCGMKLVLKAKVPTPSPPTSAHGHGAAGTSPSSGGGSK